MILLILDSNIKPIILYSYNNPLILNNIENYTLYGISNSYGLKLNNNFMFWNLLQEIRMGIGDWAQSPIPNPQFIM